PSLKFGPLPSLNSLEFLPELFKTQIERTFNQHAASQTNCVIENATATSRAQNAQINSNTNNNKNNTNNKFNNLLLADMLETSSKNHFNLFVGITNEAKEVPQLKSEPDNDAADISVNLPKVLQSNVNMNSIVNTSENDAADLESKLMPNKSAEAESLPCTNMGADAVNAAVGDRGNNVDDNASGRSSLKVRDEFVKLKNQSGSEMRASDNHQTTCPREEQQQQQQQHKYASRQCHQQQQPQLHLHHNKNNDDDGEFSPRHRSHSRDSSQASSGKNNCLADDGDADDNNKGSSGEEGKVGVANTTTTTAASTPLTNVGGGADTGDCNQKTTSFPSVNQLSQKEKREQFSKIK
ncbi:putative uncharacterized protein DDB_G0271606, partial [Musca vetustissima]|uniref:putative uncharacterized protein DDB_G0271606 n=1 Tax=Musca vetustissima TaxID=27455 RepID=UPI002AB61BB2